MIYKFFYFLFKIFPGFRRWFWKKWYNMFAKKVHEIQFMNYGYSSKDLVLDLKEEDVHNRYPIYLYHHVASQIDLTDKKVLEVGSGRGGGASYVARYMNPSEIIGLDISESAVKNCNETYKIDNLSFLAGDSEKLPFKDNYFDAVLNIESSHCYGSMSKFINEVIRVLKPGGYFLFCDLRKNTLVNEMMSSINTDNLQLINQKDITSNIIKATTLMSKERKESIKELESGFFKKVLESFAAVEGSKVHNSFKDGYFKYISACSRKS